MTNAYQQPENLDAILSEVVARFGTPAYAFDIRRLRVQVEKLRGALPADVEVLYSLKANASLGVSQVLAECGVGADVASAGELATARRAGFASERIFVAGPFKTHETLEQLRLIPQAVVSIDSPSELEHLARAGMANPAVLRLRPDFGSCAVVRAGDDSRFGFTECDISACRQRFASLPFDVIGFHVFAGSQVLDVAKLNEHLRRSLELSLGAAESLGVEPTYFNLGGGFGVPYGDQPDLDLDAVSDELNALAERARPARLVLELGRYLVAEAGWYLTSVLGRQTHQGRDAVVVDGGVHQRADMCGLNLRTSQRPPLVLGKRAENVRPVDILGCLSLPDDVMLEQSPLPPLETGDVLAFGNAGAYGMWSSPSIFHGSPLPAEAAFDGEQTYLMRERKPAESILADQQLIPTLKLTPNA